MLLLALFVCVASALPSSTVFHLKHGTTFDINHFQRLVVMIDTHLEGNKVTMFVNETSRHSEWFELFKAVYSVSVSFTLVIIVFNICPVC